MSVNNKTTWRPNEKEQRSKKQTTNNNTFAIKSHLISNKLEFNSVIYPLLCDQADEKQCA